MVPTVDQIVPDRRMDVAMQPLPARVTYKWAVSLLQDDLECLARRQASPTPVALKGQKS